MTCQVKMRDKKKMVSEPLNGRLRNSSRSLSSRQGRAAAASGFTLIELLVVVAILALLAAILFPVFARARENARRASCASNLKQLGIALHMYAQDYDERLPSCGQVDGSGDMTGNLQPYVKSDLGMGVWRCPSHSKFVIGTWSSSYGYNWQYLFAQGTAPGDPYPHVGSFEGYNNPGVPLSFLAHPAQTLAFIDQSEDPGWVPSYVGDTALYTFVNRPLETDHTKGFGRPEFRHNGTANVLYCDGHVKAMQPLVAEPSNEQQYWDPR